MKEIRCVSNRYKTEADYSKHKLKLLVKKLYLVPLFLIMLIFLACLKTEKWDAFLILTIGILVICSLILGIRYFILDPKFYRQSFSFKDNEIHLTKNNKIYILKIEKVSNARIFRNFLFLEWVDYKFPWIKTLKIEDIDIEGRDILVKDLINRIKLDRNFKDLSNQRFDF